MAFRSDLDALILGVLQAGPMHGYDISKKIRQLSDEILKVGEGQLYPALHRLEQAGQIHAEWQPQEGKPAKKIYALTEKGDGDLQKQKKDWAKFSQGVGSVLNLKAVEG